MSMHTSPRLDLADDAALHPGAAAAAGMAVDAGIDGNIAALLWAAARTAADRPAIVERERETTYAALLDRARGVAALLAEAGVVPGDRVAILHERGATAVAALFGALAAGAIVTVVNDRLRPRQIEYVLQHAGARVLLASADLLARQPRAIETAAHVVDPGTATPGVAGAPVARVGADAALIVYTSGSTGMPKGVTFTHANVAAAVRAVVHYLGLRADDRVASLLPLSSVYGLNQLLTAVACGAALVVDHSPVPNQIATVLREQGVTVLAAVPPLWIQLLAAPAFASSPIPSLRLLQNAGGHLPVDAVRRLRAAQPHARLFLQYGLTETFRSTFLDPDEVDRRPDCMGRAIPGAEILVLREDLTPCADGEIGELVHRGPTVAAGYWHDPERSARTFRPNPMRVEGMPDTERVVFSGDMVRRDADGYLYFVGRADRIIKSLGYRIGPDEIVDVLFASGQISEGVVTTEPDAQRGERIVAIVVLAAGGDATRLEHYSRTELPRHMQPARIEVRDAIPRLPSGKYDIAALRERAPAP